MAFIKVGNCLITISKRRALDAVSKFAVLGGNKNELLTGVSRPIRIMFHIARVNAFYDI